MPILPEPAVRHKPQDYLVDNDHPAIAAAAAIFAERFSRWDVLRSGRMPTADGEDSQRIQVMGDLSIRVFTPDGRDITVWSEPGAFRAQP